MGVSKDWLIQQIENEINLDARQAYQKVYSKLTEALDRTPKEIREKLKVFDPDKVYEEIVKYYIDKKGYSKERANMIAQQTVQEQQQKRLEND